MNISSIKQTIVNKLRPLNPEKVILFGSFANGTPHENSDIDLYIVSRETFTPCNYAENMQHYKKYTCVLRELKEQHPMDIIVHTLDMNKLFEDAGSSFAREIVTRGTRLL